MRIKRYKKIQRAIGFFEKNFGFRKPFQIMVDGTFAQAALQTKVNIREQLPKYLDGEVKLLTTPCAVIETEKIGKEVYGALQILKQYAIHKCSHEEARRASSCIASMVKPNNPNRYVVATQDATLRERLRKVPGVALLYLHGNAPTLEKPSDKSVQFAMEKNLEKVEVLDYQKEILSQMKKDAFGQTPESSGCGKKRKRKGGPNPLSCKKPKKKTSILSKPSRFTGPTLPGTKPKRKRIKVKLPTHVKQELKKSTV